MERSSYMREPEDKFTFGLWTVGNFKPVRLLAVRGAEVAVSLARHEQIATDRTVNNGKLDVRSILLEPVRVDRENLESTVIKDGFHRREEVFKETQ